MSRFSVLTGCPVGSLTSNCRDTVNVVARVEQLTKTTGDTILLTDQTLDALAQRPPGLVDRGLYGLKGKSAELRVFTTPAGASR